MSLRVIATAATIHMNDRARSRSFWATAARAAVVVVTLQAAVICQTNGSLNAANTMPGQVGSQVVAPRLVNYSGTTTDLVGKAKNGVNGITFSLYDQPTAGTPVWTETQNVAVDKDGSYSVVLGITRSDGISDQLFVSGASRWLGIQLNNNVESPRTVFTSVPFAFHASSADSLAGEPASAFIHQDQILTQAGRDEIGLTPAISQEVALQLPGVLSQIPAKLAGQDYDISMPLNGQQFVWKNATKRYELRSPLDTDVRDFGAICDGTTDDTQAIQSAIDSLRFPLSGSKGGKLKLPSGTCVITHLNMDGAKSIVIDGQGSSAAAYESRPRSTTLWSNAAGSADLISMRSSYGITIQNLQITVANPSFTGCVINMDHSSVSPSDSTMNSVYKVSITGASGAGAASGICLNRAIEVDIRNSNFARLAIGIKGRDKSSYSNVVKIDHTQFLWIQTMPIRNPGEMWEISNNTFEGCGDGNSTARPCAIDTTDLGDTYQTSIHSNWFGDAYGKGVWIDWCGYGLTVTGNLFAQGYNDSAAVQINGDQGGACEGVSVFSNTFANVPWGVQVVGHADTYRLSVHDNEVFAGTGEFRDVGGHAVRPRINGLMASLTIGTNASSPYGATFMNQEVALTGIWSVLNLGGAAKRASPVPAGALGDSNWGDKIALFRDTMGFGAQPSTIVAFVPDAYGKLCLRLAVAGPGSASAGSDVACLNGNGSFTSTTPIGIPPFKIASTTEVPNLNAELFHGKAAVDFQAQLSFGSILPQECTSQVILVAYSTPNAVIIPGWPATLESGLIGNMIGTAPGELAVRICNLTASVIVTNDRQTFSGRILK